MICCSIVPVFFVTATFQKTAKRRGPSGDDKIELSLEEVILWFDYMCVFCVVLGFFVFVFVFIYLFVLFGGFGVFFLGGRRGICLVFWGFF